MVDSSQNIDYTLQPEIRMKFIPFFKLSFLGVVLACMLCVILCCNCYSNRYDNDIKCQTISSPDSTLVVSIWFEEDLKITVTKSGDTIINDIQLNISQNKVNNVIDFSNCESDIQLISSQNCIIKPEFYTESELRDCYREYKLTVNNDWSIVFRLYNDTFAYRWHYKGDRPIKIFSEKFYYGLAANDSVVCTYIPHNNPKIDESQFRSSFQGVFTNDEVEDINPVRLIYLPMLFRESKYNVLFSEVNLSDYPGLYLKKNGNGFKATFPKYPRALKKGGSGGEEYLVTDRYDYIAEIHGGSILPWRSWLIANNEGEILESASLYLLSTTSRIKDTSWIHPGKAIWDWWHNNDIYGVDFNVGMNTDTYKYYIDFAHKNRLPYILIDAGWYDLKSGDPTQPVKSLDINKLVEYADKKGIGIFLWIQQSHLNDNIEGVAKFCRENGIKGLKVDIINRDDQEMNAFLYRSADLMAKHKIMLVYHGCSKPGGLNRTYPNVLSFENVRGLEQMKWEGQEYDQVIYDTYFPFLRQVVGPIDYTPGAMSNAPRNQYYPSFNHPMSQGTRTHQMAMYVVIYSPFAVLCDTPVKYSAEEECVNFISSVPTYWDESKVLDGKIGEYIVIARRKGTDWYIGGITNWKERDINLNLSFLGDKSEYKSILFTDGINSKRNGCDFDKGEAVVDQESSIKIHMMPGGGFAGHLIKCD